MRRGRIRTAMWFMAYAGDGSLLREDVFYSVGGGFILSAGGACAEDPRRATGCAAGGAVCVWECGAVAGDCRRAWADDRRVGDGERVCACMRQDLRTTGLLIAAPGATGIVRPRVEHRAGASIERAGAVGRRFLRFGRRCRSPSAERGLRTQGILPGGLSVRRRAPRPLWERPDQALDDSGRPRDPLAPIDWVSLFAIGR